MTGVCRQEGRGLGCFFCFSYLKGWGGGLIRRGLNIGGGLIRGNMVGLKKDMIAIGEITT